MAKIVLLLETMLKIIMLSNLILGLLIGRVVYRTGMRFLIEAWYSPKSNITANPHPIMNGNLLKATSSSAFTLAFYFLYSVSSP